MLKISLLDLLSSVLPESFLFIFASYLFNHKKFDRNRIIASIIIFSFAVYFIRLLPIQFGIHTILNILVYVAICIKINRIPFTKSITYSLILMAMLSLSEQLNYLILYHIFGQNVQTILNNDLFKNLCFMPSMLLFFIGIIICYKVFYRKRANI
ncbi:hypothetical protein [Clostridium tyrobutyricum]|uniref:hypothetical protein n=1 Tax=Clostridium tyrobutyricum TaxID=1519 RepID=UPI0011CCA0D6|nr:hypothetical protein [Clostridium tyrobutyricum]